MQYHDQMAAEANREEYVPYYMLGGARGRFRNIANQHYKELEKELGNEQPTPLYTQLWVTEAQMKAKK